MSKTTITIKDKATMTAEGSRSHKLCKPVVCIDTGVVYTSATDAAEALHTTQSNISTACLGQGKTAKKMRFCYVQDFPEHLHEVTSRISAMSSAHAELTAKARAYDALMAEQRAKEQAEEKARREAERLRISKESSIRMAEAKVERWEKLYQERVAAVHKAEEVLYNARRELKELQRGNGSKKLNLALYEVKPHMTCTGEQEGFEVHINGVYNCWQPTEEKAEHYINILQEGTCANA